jgi:hypothetical protein
VLISKTKSFITSGTMKKNLIWNFLLLFIILAKTFWGQVLDNQTGNRYIAIENSKAADGYGEISQTTERPKTVHVNGYYRKDGTYVKPHYRSAPRKK